MSQAVLRPNLTKKFQWEVSQIGDKERSLAPLYRWFKCKLKPPKNSFRINLVENKCQYFQKWQFFYPLSVCFHLITSLILIRSTHTKLELSNNFRAPMPKQKKV